MEKIGLFDLIDKIASPKTDEKSFRPAENPPRADGNGARGDKQNVRPASESMHDPDFGVQPQYMMNSKMQAFLKRHENLKADVPPAAPKKRAEKSPRAEKTYTKKSAGTDISGVIPKTRGRKAASPVKTSPVRTNSAVASAPAPGKRAERTKKAEIKPE